MRVFALYKNGVAVGIVESEFDQPSEWVEIPADKLEEFKKVNNIPNYCYQTEQDSEEPTPEEKLRADIDFLAIMMGVEL